MASPSNPPHLPSNSTVTHEEFKAFHKIDRTLFTKLVLFLHRDPSQSMKLMAFWLCLERSGLASNLVHNVLFLPDSLINSLADESLFCMNCMENDQFYHFFSDTNLNDVPLIRGFTKANRVSLRFFHDNRSTILRSITRIFNEVCVRAFNDILRLTTANKVVDTCRRGGNESKPLSGYGGSVNVSHRYGEVGVIPLCLGSEIRGGNSSSFHGFDVYDVEVQRQVMNNEICDMLSRIEIKMSDDDNVEEKEVVVPPDDRTIFLTFSKGYPISEDEISDFFTRKYGDRIEAIYMQEVVEEDQPLYARLVVQSPWTIAVVLEGKSKAKFSINGKHVWARKYVRKNSKLSPPQPSSPLSSSQPTSPSAAAATTTILI